MFPQFKEREREREQKKTKNICLKGAVIVERKPSLGECQLSL